MSDQLEDTKLAASKRDWYALWLLLRGSDRVALAADTVVGSLLLFSAPEEAMRQWNRLLVFGFDTFFFLFPSPSNFFHNRWWRL